MYVTNFSSIFLVGKSIAAVREIVIEKGVIKTITNESGHYKPSLELVKKNMSTELNKRSYFGYTNREKQVKFNHGFLKYILWTINQF